MPGRKEGKHAKSEEIFEEYSMEDSDLEAQKDEAQISKGIKPPSSENQEEEGEILNQEESYSGEQNLMNEQDQLQALNKNKQKHQMYQDSSEQDNDRLEKEKKKREQFWKHKIQKNQEIQTKKPLTQAELLQVAFAALQKSNKRVMLMRKKNQKRMQDLQKIRMAQQPYLTTGNTHFRGSSSEYAIITHDSSGKTYLHPNHTFRVGQMRLENFISKNIKQQSTANYLNQVVKFQNYAYQQRKKRRHNIQ